MEITTKSARETQKLGEKIGRGLKQGTILALSGELGSGKTTFTQGLARGLGIKKRILSPTFVYVRQYPVKRRSLSVFYHVDLYRIKDDSDSHGLGLEEILADPKAVVAIEWADKIKKILPAKRVDFFFQYLSDKERKIKIGE